MPPVPISIPAIIRSRARKRGRMAHPKAVYLGWSIALLFSLSATLLAFFFTWGYLNLVNDLPSLAQLPILVDGNASQLRQPTRLFDRTGEHLLFAIQDPGAANNSYLLLEALPPAIITTTLNSTDPDFWQHSGYHLDNQPPTLAERIVTDLLLWDEPAGPRRQWRARLLAAQATTRYGRKKILEWYLNHIPYGPNVYGIDSAAHAYLGKSATQLTLAEAAFLTAASERPAIHPVQAAELTRQRQTEILLDLSTRGLISPLESVQASQENLPLVQPQELTSVAPTFTDLVLQQIATQISPERLAYGGFKIVTTLDLNLQAQATCAIQAQLARLQTQPAPDCEASRLLPTIFNSIPVTSSLDASAVILDPDTGQVMAYVGETFPGDDRKHAAGSLLTPFVYLSAFARGSGPATLAWDVPGEPGAVNFDNRYHGPLRLRTALANDYLVPAAQIFNKIGATEIWHTMGQFGLSPGSDAQNSFSAFTSNQVSLLEATHALSAFAAEGTLAGQSLDATPHLHPSSVLRLEGVDGRIWLDWGEAKYRPVIGAQLAYLENHALSDEPARWPSLGHPNPLEIGRPAAVKLSQTPAGNDTWTVGGIPQRIVGVWVGRPGETDAGSRVSPFVAAAIWHALVQYAGRELPIADWQMPAGVVNVAVCDPSGLLPTVECPNVINEVFIAGNQPTRLDDLYRSIPVNRLTGLLATVFTPPSLVEERVYINTPPEAVDWARQAGLPIPPTSYDIIGIQPLNPDVHFSSPINFNAVMGTIELYGTAGGDDFASFRLLVGAGLNPQRWLQIGEESITPVENGLLGKWDAGDLSGLYAIQLQVVRKNSQVETAILQVTVDNQPPITRLKYPLDGQTVTPSQTGYVFLQAESSDDLSLGRIEFFVDDTLVGTLYPQMGEVGPFNLAWKSTAGQHSLQVIAYDRAGNFNQSKITFNTR